MPQFPPQADGRLLPPTDWQVRLVAAEVLGRFSRPENTIALTRLVADPVAVVERLYATWDLAVTPTFRKALDTYLAARHTNRTGGHDYSFADTGLDLATHRALVAPYQERYGVPSEV